MPAITKEDVKKYLKEAPMLEISELVKEIESEFGVSAAAAMPMMAAPGAAAAAPAVRRAIARPRSSPRVPPGAASATSSNTKAASIWISTAAAARSAVLPTGSRMTA